ncbi:MAG: prepilin-type N-terminal cleavage/methylation domain-containing protein [bacterium]|nr:prepilin-type N-terminal cleavage/methylation domain-containing protein [bacterium]
MAQRKRNDRGGFTLMEIVIAVAIVAIFAAAISPMVFKHLEDAKLSRAQNETETLATAVLSYYKDTGAWPYTNANGPTGNGVARVISSPNVATGAGTGASPGAVNWGTYGNSKLLGDYLYHNNPDDDTSVTGAGANQAGEDWPTAGRGAWRGPYVTSYQFDDPWGNAYVLNMQYAPGGNYAGTVRHKVFVLSAGPDGRWQTGFNNGQAEEIAGDDIGTVVTIR